MGLDSAPLIYFIEQNPTYLEMMRLFFRALNQGEFRVVTSVITLPEVLVYPLRQGNITLAQQYRDILFNSEGLILGKCDRTLGKINAISFMRQMRDRTSVFIN